MNLQKKCSRSCRKYTRERVHIAALLLSDFHECYETLVTVLDTRLYDELTLENVKDKLMDEYKQVCGTEKMFL